MKLLRDQLFKTVFFGLASLVPSGAADAQEAEEYRGSLFRDVWTVVQDGPYQSLPNYRVNLDSFYHYLKDKLQQASKRTLDNRSDTLPNFQKLVHPIGICFAGTWNITEPNPYSGYFRQGSQGLTIFRASSALGHHDKGEKRAFGFAGKIYPTLNRDHTEPLETANFFTIDNLAGTYAPSFLKTALTNDVTAILPDLTNIDEGLLLPSVVKAFSLAEKGFSIITVRQLYEISELGEGPGAKIETPKWLKIEGRTDRQNFLEDFRDDLRLEVNGGKLIFDIYVGSKGVIGLPKKWERIGYIEATEQALANGCDHRLHFHHPKWRKD